MTIDLHSTLEAPRTLLFAIACLNLVSREEGGGF